MKRLTESLAVVLALSFVPTTLAGDLAPGGVRLISRSGPGKGANGDCGEPAISANGKKIAVRTIASNLGPNTFNGFRQVLGFRRDASLVGVLSKSDVIGLANLDCNSSKLSKTGRYVAFQSDSNFGIQGLANGSTQVFRRDQKSGVVVHVSIGPNGNTPNAATFVQQISDDGNYVLFWTAASNLLFNDNTLKFRGYVRDVAAGTTELVTVTSAEVPLNTNTLEIDMSGDGRYVFFGSNSTLLGYGSDGQVYVRDRVLGTTTLLSKNQAGLQGAATSTLVDASNNGRFVLFLTNALNLVQPLEEGKLLLLDRQTGGLRALDISIPGFSISEVTREGRISNDGSRLILGSNFTDTTSGAKKYAIYEYDLATGEHWLVSEVPGKWYLGCHLLFEASATCEWVAFTTEVDLIEENGVIDTYLYRAH